MVNTVFDHDFDGVLSFMTVVKGTPIGIGDEDELAVNTVYFAYDEKHLGVKWHEGAFHIEVSDADPEGGSPGAPN